MNFNLYPVIDYLMSLENVEHGPAGTNFVGAERTNIEKIMQMTLLSNSVSFGFDMFDRKRPFKAQCL